MEAWRFFLYTSFEKSNFLSVFLDTWSWFPYKYGHCIVVILVSVSVIFATSVIAAVWKQYRYCSSSICHFGENSSITVMTRPEKSARKLPNCCMTHCIYTPSVGYCVVYNMYNYPQVGLNYLSGRWAGITDGGGGGGSV